MPVEAGKRVMVSLNSECVDAGGRRVYPDGWVGTMTGSEIRHEKLAEIDFGSDEATHTDKNNRAYIPRWLLVQAAKA